MSMQIADPDRAKPAFDEVMRAISAEAT